MKIKKILVSQPKPENKKSPYFDLAEKYGLQVDFRPFIHVEGISSKEFRKSRVNILDHTAIIFKSRTAIDHFFRICEELRVNVPDSMKYFCTSEASAFYLQKYIVYRKRKIFYGNGDFNDLLTIIKKHKKENSLDIKLNYLSEFNEIISYLKNNLSKDDLLITIGAGNVYEIGEELVGEQSEK